MINKFLETLYTKVFINIVVENLQTIVYVEVRSKNKTLSSLHKIFETTILNAKMHDFILSCFRESPYHYVAILDKSSKQGAVPTCKYEEMANYADMTSMEYKCYSDKWAFYTSEYGLEAIKHEYRSVGLDFVFSPFALLANFFEDKINSSFAMFILVESNYMSICIFERSKLLFAQHLDIRQKDEDEMLIDSSLEENIAFDIDGVDLDEMSISDDGTISFDDFTNIEELDEVEDIDEFSPIQDIQESTESQPAKEVDISSGAFNEDYHRFSLIQESLNTFYKDSKYESRFVETVYIADAVGLKGDLKNFLEEEMFLSVYVRKMDLAASLSDMAKGEANEI